MKIDKIDQEPIKNFGGDYQENFAWATRFISNFNDIYTREEQSFFIKLCRDEHNKYYIAFILHPYNTFPHGNSVCIVHLNQSAKEFKEDFRAGYKTIFIENAKYLQKIVDQN